MIDIFNALLALRLGVAAEVIEPFEQDKDSGEISVVVSEEWYNDLLLLRIGGGYFLFLFLFQYCAKKEV